MQHENLFAPNNATTNIIIFLILDFYQSYSNQSSNCIMINIKLLFLLTMIFLASCFHAKETPIDPSHIKIDDDIYLKPLGKNDRGCSMFSPYSLEGVKLFASNLFFVEIG